MKKIPKLVVVTGLIFIALFATLTIVNAVSDNFLLGELFKKNAEKGDSDVIAEINGAMITAADIEREMKINEITGIEKKSEADVLNDLILKQIYLSEAEKLGLLPDAEECAEFVNGQKQFYEESSELAAIVDEYCKGAGMTLEEYWLDLEKRAPRVIARTKVYNRFHDEYYERNGLEKNVVRTQEELNDFNAEYQKYREALLAEYDEYILYYK